MFYNIDCWDCRIAKHIPIMHKKHDKSESVSFSNLEVESTREVFNIMVGCIWAGVHTFTCRPVGVIKCKNMLDFM